jgi:peptidoglycan/LPS O-acetylase OafA/YrhL
MYYVAVFYSLWQHGLGPRYWLADAPGLTPANILANLLFIHDFSPYWINGIVTGGWSVGVETTFYLILPYLFSKIKNINGAVKLFFISIIIKGILHQVVMPLNPIQVVEWNPRASQNLWNYYLGFYFPNQFPTFVLGIIMYFIIAEKQTLSGFSGKLLLLVSVGLLWVFKMDTSFRNNFLPEDCYMSVITLVIFVIALSKYKFRLFVNPLITHIGKISYSMYLVHFPVLDLLAKYNFIDYVDSPLVNYHVRFLITAGLSAFISTLTYHFIEVPFQQTGRGIINRAKGKNSGA